MGFLIVTNLATDTIFDTLYIGKNIEKVSPNKDAKTPTGLSPVAKEENVGDAEYISSNVKTEKRNTRKNQN